MEELEKINELLLGKIKTIESISGGTRGYGVDWSEALPAIYLYTLRKKLEQLKEIDSYDTYRQMLSCMEDIRADLEAQMKELEK